MFIARIIFILLATSAMAADANWHMVVYEGAAVKVVDPAGLDERTCKDRADANNQANKAGAEAVHHVKKGVGPAPPPRITVKCEQR